MKRFFDITHSVIAISVYTFVSCYCFHLFVNQTRANFYIIYVLPYLFGSIINFPLILKLPTKLKHWFFLGVSIINLCLAFFPFFFFALLLGHSFFYLLTSTRLFDILQIIWPIVFSIYPFMRWMTQIRARKS